MTKNAIAKSCKNTHLWWKVADSNPGAEIMIFYSFYLVNVFNKLLCDHNSGTCMMASRQNYKKKITKVLAFFNASSFAQFVNVFNDPFCTPSSLLLYQWILGVLQSKRFQQDNSSRTIIMFSTRKAFTSAQRSKSLYKGMIRYRKLLLTMVQTNWNFSWEIIWSV